MMGLQDLLILSLLSLGILGMTHGRTSHVDRTLRDLRSLVEELEQNEFESDSLLEQHYNKGTGLSTYKLEGELRTVFERQSDDRNEEVIILHPSHDGIQGLHSKTFVGLRRADSASSDNLARYYVFLIYLRDYRKPTKNEQNIGIRIGGKKSIAEFDQWINRKDAEGLRKRVLGWSSEECDSSIFFGCSDSPSPKKHEKVKKRNQHQGSNKKFVPRLGAGIHVNREIISEHGYDPKAIEEFFWDFKQDMQQGRLVTKVLGWAASGIANGVKEDAKAAVGDVWNKITGQTTTPKPGIFDSISALNPFATKPTTTTAKPGWLGGIFGGGSATTTTSTPKPGLLDSVKNLFGGKATTAPAKGRSLQQKRKVSLEDDSASKEETSNEHESIFGYGTCEIEYVTRKDIEKVKEAEDLLQTLAIALRTQCSENQEEVYKKLLSDKIIRMKPDKTFSISRNNHLANSKKLSAIQLRKLSSALEMSAFSKALEAELYRKSNTPQLPVSRENHVFVDTILRAITVTYTKLEMHRMKLLRNLARTVKSVFLRLVQEYADLQHCESCYNEVKVKHADLLVVNSLLHFIIYGLGPVFRQRASVYYTFDRFSEHNAGYVFEKVRRYLK